jgi:hypothetical protein
VGQRTHTAHTDSDVVRVVTSQPRFRSDNAIETRPAGVVVPAVSQRPGRLRVFAANKS